MTRRWISYFSDPLPEGVDARGWLGGKGASLKEMTILGLAVPPGFTICTDACAQYYANERCWPDGLEDELRANLDRLERDTGRRFGRGARPMLVSVRSGAALSMPGMMDTLLNCGLHPALADDVGDSPWFWGLYLQFITGFARTVDGLRHTDIAPDPHGSHITRDDVAAALRRYQDLTGRPFATDPWDLIKACINAVFASWQSTRAVTYRQRHDIRGLAGTAVNVQVMFPSEISGIAFTQHPTNLAANQIVIEASYGLGEAVVSGDVAPDRFVIARGNLDDVQEELGHKVSLVRAFGAPRQHDPDAACLSRPQLRELCELCLKVEQHFGHPVDMEWGLAESKFALLQSRRIRGLDVMQEVDTARQEEIARLHARCNGNRHVWVTHNLGETLRAPTPLTWDIVRSFMSGDGGFGRLYQSFGYRPSQRVRREGFLDLIAGRIYADPDRLRELFGTGLPLAYDLEALSKDRSLLDRAPAKLDVNRADGTFLLKLPRTLWSMWRVSRNMRQGRKHAKDRYDNRVLPSFLRYVEEEGKADLGTLSDAQVIARLNERRSRVLNDFAPESLRPGFFAGAALAGLEAALTTILGPAEGAELARTLTTALKGDVTFEQDAMLYRIAHGRGTLDEFLARFGHRCVGEMELAVPRWRENGVYLSQTIDRLRMSPRGPEEIHHQNLARREAAENQLPQLLQQHGGSAFREQIECDLADARALLPYREVGKFHLMMGYELIRAVIEELARRWELGGDIYHLELAELPRFVHERDALKDAIARRKLRWEAMQKIDMPDVIDSLHLDELGKPVKITGATEFAATAMAPGVATGTAKIVLDPREAGDLGSDYVLVCASTDPGWTPLFIAARGLIVERGGVLSHGAIVARDFGIPAVACPNATKLIAAGAQVRVDGNQGRVSILQK